MKTLKENEMNYNVATILFEGVNLDDEELYVSIFEIIDSTPAIHAERVQDTINMISIKTTINLLDNMIEFSDGIIYPLRDAGYKVKVIKVDFNNG